MKFSFIIPAYNCANTIGRVFESLERQSMKDFEVLVVDDCSLDNTREVVNSLIDRSMLDVKLLTLGTNYGPGAARCFGLNNAKGDYICFIDSDDYVADDYSETLSNILRNSKADLIYFGACLIIGKKKIESIPSNYPCKDSFVAQSKGSLCMFCFNKKLLENYPLPQIKNAEDIAVIPLIILSANKIAYCDKVLYYYIHNKASLSSISKPEVSYNFIKSFKYTLSYLKPPYSKGVEFHGIKTILYGAILNGLKAKIDSDELSGIIDDYEAIFPKWDENKYIQTYSPLKRLFLNLVRGRHFKLMKMYVRVHNLLLKYL